jgi:hypothetical protein
MGITFGKPEKQTKDEIMELRKTREEYMNQLKRYQTSVLADIEQKRLTPETGKAVLAKVKEANTWLQKHPNATYLEITSTQDTTNEEITKLLTIDGEKRKLRNAYEIMPTICEYYTEKENKLSKEQVKALLKEGDRLKSWYTRNQATATKLDFEQEWLQLNTTLAETITEQEIYKRIWNDFNSVAGMPTPDVLALVKQFGAKQQAAKDQEIPYDEAPTIIMSTATSVFFGFLLVVLCLSAGSVAANMAIGRTPAMRLLYFIYGAIPIFSPFILLYAIYTRIVKGPIPIYSVLPVSIEPATTRLAKLFWQLIYWVPDQDSVKAFKDYEDSLKAIVSTTSIATT